MQLKGLVRFFTILLIVYSLYQLSFTWFVRNHEKKLEAKALKETIAAFPDAKNYKKDIELMPDTMRTYYNDLFRHYADSTKNKTLTYGINGKMGYKRVKEEELSLGLDLQGGMSVTLEVELNGLLRNLANSNDAVMEIALRKADSLKANGGADFITLFTDEYKKLNSSKPLASLFAAKSNNEIDVRSSNDKVISYLRKQANEGFDITYNTLLKRIDRFGVAQPYINKNPEKKIITVELPGVKDKKRVKKELQTSANLEFWELYTMEDQDYAIAWNNLFKAYDTKYRGKDTTDSKVADTTNRVDTGTGKVPGKNRTDTTPKNNPGIAQGLPTDTGEKKTTETKQKLNGPDLSSYFAFSGFQPSGSSQKRPNIGRFHAHAGYIDEKDTINLNKVIREFRYLFPSDVAFVYGLPEKEVKDKLPLYALKTRGKRTAEIDGEMITGAGANYGTSGRIEVSLEMNRSGEKKWSEMTGNNIDKPVAIVLDSVVQSAPHVDDKIEGGGTRIYGNYTIDEAKSLAAILNIGKLKAPVKIVAETEVGPTLGKKAVEGGRNAFLISFVVIFLLMLVYYNTSGWVANIALILNLLFTVGVLSGLNATLTAPGIAGLVLTIGMAVDTNVIIYERIKEELSKGKGYIPAINEGYKRSLPPVLDAHVTTFLTAAILFYFGLGPVKGFATTQMLGIILSLFCGILVSRWVSDWFTGKKKHLEYFTGVSKRIFKHAKYKFIEYRKVAYGISIAVLLGGIAAFFNGFDLGVEFEGGRSYKIKFEKPIADIDKLRDEVKASFDGENPIIKTVGSNSKLDITTAYKITENKPETDSLVLDRLMKGLKNYLPAGITYAEFSSTKFKESSDKVLPTISKDLKQGAVKATIFALLIIFLYIFIRFRDWRYSLGTIVALLHDVFVTLIVFSFARTIVPFPLEIDQHFIAALLTVIGFSMNDTVIVFDRIREDSRLMPGAPRGEIINRAINETLSRTVMTSLTVFLTILILFIFGGEVTRGFAFAMLIGVITGTYSSIFVAAPILVDLGGKRGLGRKAPLEKPVEKKS